MAPIGATLAKFFRKQMNLILTRNSTPDGKSSPTIMSCEKERAKDAFETVVEYIAQPGTGGTG